MTVADSPANLAVYRKQRGGPTGGGSYPTLRLLALVSCGTRTVIDAVFGPTSAGEIPALLKSKVKTTTRTEETPLWDQPAALIIFLAIVGAEWVLRKRVGLP